MSDKISQFKEQIEQVEHLCEKLKLYLEWVTELARNDVAAAITVCQNAIDLACQPENEPQCSAELTHCLFTLGMLNARNGNYLEAISIIYDSMPRFEKLGEPYLQARAINVIAAANGYLGNYYEALNHFMKALEAFKEINEKNWEAAVLNNIGYQYWHLENYDWALKYLNMSLAQAEQLAKNDPEAKSIEGDVCETLCNVYMSTGNFEQALKYGLRSISLYQESGDSHGQAEVLNSIGDAHLALGQAGRALECFQQALQLARETGHKHEEVETLLRLGKYHATRSALDESLHFLQQALEAAQKLETKRSIYECHQVMAEIQKARGDYKNALVHFEEYIHLYKQVFDEKESLRIQSLEVMHQLETARKDSEIYRLKNVALQNEIDERKKAQDALRTLAITDPLTGLYNRRHFFELAEEAYQRSRVVASNLSVILIDVDNFKLVNDRYGHAVGDQVLIMLARIMQESVRKVDKVARYGGEEFVILLPDTRPEAACEVAERLRSMVESQNLHVESFQIHLGVSLGVAFYDSETDLNLEALLNRADMAMYEAKQAGGNRVHTWTTA